MKEYDSLTPELREWIAKQHIFWVGTSPPIPDGHVNVSPKGLAGTFQFITEKSAKIASQGFFTGPAKAYFAYLDIGGSGIETHSHLRASQYKNITMCFNAFEGPPKILRLFGKGVSIEPGETGWNEVLYEFDNEILDAYLAKGDTHVESKIRNIVVIEVQRIRDSCGYAVPFYDFNSERTIYPARFQTVDTIERLNAARKELNTDSIDGLIGLRWLHDEKEDPKKTAEQIRRLQEKGDKNGSAFKFLAINGAFFVAGVAITLALVKSRFV
eukprot:Phypoly_transcript_11983.p1 GENE.Phypoly_transcript_11983~~Phypoly_transcript_11983.p1  ORF type:complete len:270 (+),score=46.50 Phypoly_transcript_11983:106-915(+)